MTSIAPARSRPTERTGLVSTSASPRSWWWLLASFWLLLIADGHLTIAVAAWLAPLCLMRFLRTQPLWRGLGIAYLTVVVTRGITYYGITPIPGIFYYIFLGIAGLVSLLPYLADRSLFLRLSGVPRTLVFPASVVTVQFAGSHGPFGTWGAWPYTQASNLPLLQLLSITGLWGVTFLIAWFASSANEVLLEGFHQGRALRSFGVCMGTLLAVMVGGGLRLELYPPGSNCIRVASLSPMKTGPTIAPSLLQNVIRGKASASETAQFHAITTATQDELLERTEREARAGAKIIFWSETAAFVLKADEPGLIRKASQLAQQYQLYLGLSLGTWTPGKVHPLENKVVLIQPSGNIAWQYLKARLTPGPESAMAVKADGRLAAIRTPYGHLSTAICYDTDFAALLRQAGALQTDILVSPAGDWRSLDPRHTEMASFRAIEDGFNLVRQANLGFSAAYDYQGRLLAEMHDYSSTDFTLVAYVPTRGVRTVYSRLGDWFAWLCVGGVVVVFLLVVRRRPIADKNC